MNKSRLIESIKEFKDKKITVLGDVVLDRYVYGRVERVNPENPAAPLLKIERKELRLGCAANVALNIISLGARASLGCVIGKDHNGRLFERLCRKRKMKLFSVKNGVTIVKERAIESEFNQYLLRADDGESNLKSINDFSADKLHNFFNNSEVDALILSDYNKSIFRNGLAKRLISLARNKKIPVIVDPKPINAESFQFCNLICPNLKEAREIVRSDSNDAKFLAKQLKYIIKSDYVIVTCGKKGMICYDGREFSEIPTKAREVVDVTGAGDTACAVMTLGLASGLSLVETAHLANYAAGIVVEKQGTSTIKPEELIQRIEEDGIEKDIREKIKF